MKDYIVDAELTERIESHILRNAQARKRTAARLWVMRRQLRDYAYALHPEIDLAERREAVQKVRDEVKP